MLKNGQDILFSIIIPSHNRAHFIQIAIKSIIDQTYANWELIIIDDGSTDHTREVVSSFDDNRIRYYYKQHGEKSIARNFGIEKALGQYVSFLDDDDYYHPLFLERFNDLIIKQETTGHIFCCFENTQLEDGTIIPERFSKEQLLNPLRLFWEEKTSIKRFVIPRQVFQSTGFNPEYPLNEDFDLAIRLMLKFPVQIVPHHLCTYVQHPQQVSKTKFGSSYKQNALRSIKSVQQLIDENQSALFQKIPVRTVFDLLNHKIYGYASKSMKNKDFSLMYELIRKFSLKGSPIKISYYFLSLLVRTPIHVFKK